MSSNSIDDEKPNLRPRKFVDTNGKSLGTCYCLTKSWGGSSISVRCNNLTKYRKRVVLDKPGLFGIKYAFVEYSLHKQKRWELFDDIRQNSTYPSDLSSDDESSTESQLKQRKRSHSTSTIPQDVYHIKIDSYLSERYRRKSRKPLSLKLIAETRKLEGHTENCYTCIQNEDPRTETVVDDFTYTIDVSTRRKQILSIRTNHGKNNFKERFYSRKKHCFTKEPSDGDTEELSSDDDDDELLDSPATSSKFHPLQLNDFLPLATDKYDPKSRQKYCTEMCSNRHVNQFSQEKNRTEKIYYQYFTTDVNRKSVHNQNIPSKPKSRYHFMSLSFCSVALNRTELTEEYLSKIYGKKFIHAQCSPTKYLICLTDRLRSFSWSNKPDLVTLNSYLVLIFIENIKTDENICYGQVGVNIDLNAQMFNLNNLLTSKEKVYRVEELIEKAIELLRTLPVEVFKPIDSEISQRKLAKDGTDHQLSEIEFFNKQIQQVHLLNTNDLQTQLNNSIYPRPNICTICCEDMDEFTPMTSLKTCGHWLCNNCWKQYLQNSIEHIKLIVCLEWNCTCVVDAGTILSLVNVCCLNIYERHIEKCLLNLSRSYVRCPLISCSNIIPIIDSSTLDYVRCRCGYEFCLECKQEAHFPATCRSHQVYIHIAQRNGHLTGNSTPITTVIGRKCISCNQFIEKMVGGCNHMRCRCGAEFCWICTGYWNEHSMSFGIWRCPKEAIGLQERIIVGDTNPSKHFYAGAIYHRQQRTFQVQAKLKEYAKRLIATIPLDKDALSDCTINKIQVDQRRALFEHCFQMIEYIKYLHRICEYTCVSAEGYGSQPKQFFNSLRQFELIIFNFIRIFESGRGYSAMEHFNQLYQRSQIPLQRLRHAVQLRRMHQINRTGYITS